MMLETNRLLLREMNPDDYQALYRVLGDPETMRHYPCAFDGQRVKDWIERNIKRYREDGFGLWAVCLKETGELIGDCGLTLQNIRGEILPEIGYHIRRDCRRKGYAGEAAMAVRNWAFQNTDYPALYSYCKYTNVPSIKTAESIGMHFACEYPDETNGKTHVSVVRREDLTEDMRSGMHIVKAEADQAEKIVEMSLRAFETDVNVGGAKDDCPPEYDSVEWHKQMAREGHLYQAMIENDLVGAAIVFPDETEKSVYIGRIFIDSVYHRKGYGIRLMECIEKHFPFAAEFNLDTPCWNKRTNAFYKKLGYRIIKVEDGFVFYRKRKNEPNIIQL